MPDFETLEPAIDPNNRITFLLDWELTMKCNLDCSYCEKGLYGGHDNSLNHPSIDECYKTIDFMYKYVDLYMSNKPNGLKYVILNMYGGESLYHPRIVELLDRCREIYLKTYKDRWNLTITTTTNAILSDKKLQSIIPYIDEFTCSYHTEATTKQKEQFKKNLLRIKESGKRIKCVVLMHPEEKLFNDAHVMIDWCLSNGIKYLPRQLDHMSKHNRFNYDTDQVKWFESMYQSKSYKSKVDVEIKINNEKIDLADTGRACCGGRQVCKDQNYKERDFFVDNKFTDWYCSVNEFFVYIKQVTGEIFTNKDCKMNFNGAVGAIGSLNDYQVLLNNTEEFMKTKKLPVIQCKKLRCFCGLCAPKSKSIDDFKSIMAKFRKKV